MNLIDAIKSGRPFRRETWGDDMWAHACADKDGETTVMFTDGTTFQPYVFDLVADDWEIQEQSITITRSEFLNAFSVALKDVENRHGFRIMSFQGRDVSQIWRSEVIAEMVRKLGLEK